MAVEYPIHLAFFGLGGEEWLVVLVVGLLVIGPKDLPPLVRGAVALWRKILLMAHEFQTMFEDMANEMDAKKHADDIKNKIIDAAGIDVETRDNIKQATSAMKKPAIKNLSEVEVIEPTIAPPSNSTAGEPALAKKKKSPKKIGGKAGGKVKQPKRKINERA
ncbi:MAG: twin-arginine translocase TatA/TatE family subunit [Hydrotalea sp.]|nr:twin-arginine translocase TatA/TatE family subunit [Hydrotalea sp.]